MRHRIRGIHLESVGSSIYIQKICMYILIYTLITSSAVRFGGFFRFPYIRILLYYVTYIIQIDKFQSATANIVNLNSRTHTNGRVVLLLFNNHIPTSDITHCYNTSIIVIRCVPPTYILIILRVIYSYYSVFAKTRTKYHQGR